jgi:predicted outer membrane protein
MVLDHMALESQLAAVATENAVQLPNAPSEQAKQEMATLQGMNGAKFDAAYMQHMVQGTSKSSRSSNRRRTRRNPNRLKPLLPPLYRSSSSTWRLPRR